MNDVVKYIFGIFVIGAVVFVSYQVIGQWHRKEMTTALNNQREEHLRQIVQLEKQLTDLQSQLNETEELKAETQPSPPTEAIEEVFGQETQVTALGKHDENCIDLSQQAKALFTHIDKQGYLAEGGFDTPFLPFLHEILQLLADKPPVLVAEMDDIFLLAKNVSHIYRVIGSKRIKVLKTIIEEENDVLEPAMAVLFGWFKTCRKSEAPPPEIPQLKTMYEYAGFFLNTLGGRSYLLRRESKVRMLVNYYSVLILDLANEEKLNSAGIDIRNYIDALMVDLVNQQGLVYRDRYLAELKQLKEKYQQP